MSDQGPYDNRVWRAVDEHRARAVRRLDAIASAAVTRAFAAFIHATARLRTGDAKEGSPQRGPSLQRRRPVACGRLGRGGIKLAGDAIHTSGNRSEVVRTKLIIAPVVALGLSFTGIGIAAEPEAGASPQPKAAPASPMIMIKDFKYDPADVTGNVGQAFSIVNNDGFSHTVTAKDGTFNVDVPGNGSVTLTVPKAGTFPYSCTYHPGQHNPATIKVS